jgi:hypothetical protein
MLFLGNVGQQLDIGDLDGEIGAMRSALGDNEDVDREQARSITDLRREHQEMKLYLAALVRLLVSKGLLQPEEVEITVQAVERDN